MKLALALTTADRPDYTARTLDALASHVDMERFAIRVHGDDASETGENRRLAERHGFETVYAPARRSGGWQNRVVVCREAIGRGADWVLLLENDWDAVRDVPWRLLEDIEESDPTIGVLRLYGAYKERGNRRMANFCHLGKDGRPKVEWEPYVAADEAEVGHIHWTAGPALTRASYLNRVIGQTGSNKTAWEVSASLPERTVRVLDNVFYHFGDELTPGFMA